MTLHGNAALTPKQRLRLVSRVVEEGWSLSEAAEAAVVTERTARKWVDRYRAEGEAGPLDRPSAPNSQPGRRRRIGSKRSRRYAAFASPARRSHWHWEWRSRRCRPS
jgi:transposase